MARGLRMTEEAYAARTAKLFEQAHGTPITLADVKKSLPKYRNVKTEVDGIKFDSKKEAKRWQELRALQKAGKLRDLAHQWRYFLVPAQTRADGKKERRIDYVADFAYVDADGVTHVEDVKSPASRKLPAYIIKRKLMLFIHGITVREV